MILEINNALRSFWESFGIPVFFQNLAQDPLPVITFEFGVTDFAENYAISARLWTRDASHPKISTGFPEIYWEILGEIERAVPPKKGLLLSLENEKGLIWIGRGTPFIIHNIPDEQPTIKTALINLNVKYYTI